MHARKLMHQPPVADLRTEPTSKRPNEAPPEVPAHSNSQKQANGRSTAADGTKVHSGATLTGKSTSNSVCLSMGSVSRLSVLQ